MAKILVTSDLYKVDARVFFGDNDYQAVQAEVHAYHGRL